ncbi:MAG: hypothetical protein AB7O52_18385 [Planctomycetota bacterium]
MTRILGNAGLAAVVSSLAIGLSFGQDPNLTLRVGDASGQGGTTIATTVFFDNIGLAPVAAWSYGVCHDTAILTLLSANDSALVQTINGGAAPGFGSTTHFVEGATQGIVIDLFGVNDLPPGTGLAFLELEYGADLRPRAGDPTTQTELRICDSLGSPAVNAVIVVDTAAITPTTTSGTIRVFGPDGPPFVAFGETVQVLVSGTTASTSTVAVGFGYRDPDLPNDGPSDTQGFTMFVNHSGSLLTVDDLRPVGSLTTINGGMGPMFFTPNLNPGPGPGWGLGVIYNLSNDVFIQFSPVGERIVEASYSFDSSSLIVSPCSSQSVVVELDWAPSIGTPTFSNVVVVNNASVSPIFENGRVEVTISCAQPAAFRRGDCNDDGQADIADIVASIGFVAGSLAFAATCPAACDANDDRHNDVSDAVYLAAYVFLNGASPAPPFPWCGQMPGVDDTSCAFQSCP